MNFDSEFERYLCAAEHAIKHNLPETDGDSINVTAEAARYSVMCGGKRLRPVILLASAEAYGGSRSFDEAMPYAAAIEMIHTYSLIHDDLPAMDDDEYRRGMPSCHKKYGEAYAILAGDALLNGAYEAIFRELMLSEGDSSTKRLVNAAGIIAEAAGIKGMVLGQTADIYFENTDISSETLEFINARKTGALISASFEAGAVIGGADRRQAETFALAGMKVGAAFQIRDDVLDVVGKPQALGKPAGSDIKNNKTTFASALGIQKCDEKIRELSGEAVALLETTGVSVDFFIALIDMLTDRNK